jgi:hypothetical protein
MIVTACATGHQATSVKLRKLVTERNFNGAIDCLKTSPLVRDEKSKLLYYIELGLLEHYRGNYEASNVNFSWAKQLVDELYTTRLSGKVSSFISNDNADIYYGEKYEASLVYFYLSLNNYLQAMSEIDPIKKRDFLAKARSEVVAWDSFLAEIKEERLGKALFKEDLLAKTFGALIHESQGNHQDKQIALQLYKDAQLIFFRNYNLYPTFNRSYESFRQNFSSFPNLPAEEVAGKYVLETEHTQAFKEFLRLKIESLSSTNPKLKKKETDGSITVLLQDGLIAEKVPQRYEFPMIWGAHASMAFTMGLGSKVEFELPTIRNIEVLKGSRLQAIDQTTGLIVKEAPLSVIAPLSELAQQAINEHSTAIASKTAARVATKHIAALVASAATYEAGRQRNNMMMMLFASAGHAASVAAINESERADVRFWSTLPSNIRMGSMNLPKGTYIFRAIIGDTGAAEYRVIELGVQEVANESLKFVMNRNEQQKPVDTVAVSTVIEVRPDYSSESQINRSISSESATGNECTKDSKCSEGKTCSIGKGEVAGWCQ